MDNPYDWEEEWEWEKVDKPQPIEGQLSFFPAGKISSFLNEEEKINISLSFEEIIYENPAYTEDELIYLYSQAQQMEDDCA